MTVLEAEISTLADRVIQARRHRKLNRIGLAVRAGYDSESTIRRYETGKVIQPTIAVIERLAAALGCDPVWLMFGRGSPDWDPDWQ